jgi:hypothetical protein
MDEINDIILFKKIKINESDNLRSLIKNFCNYAYDELDIDSIFKIEDWLNKLLEFEIFLSLTKKRHRDHLKHACRIALLGDDIMQRELIFEGKKFKLIYLIRELLLLNPQSKKIFKMYNIDINEPELLDKKILQVWLIAAIFHDIGFIYEAFVESWKNIHFLKEFPNFKELYLGIESEISNFERSFRVSEMHSKHVPCDLIRGFDHGEIGACLISNLLCESNFICDMAAIIADCHTSKEEINFVDNPLSFLMIVLDEVQEWQRPAVGRKMEDQVLSENVGNYMGFRESINDKPELDNISLTYEINKINDTTANILLDFVLDYGDKKDILEKTSFSFPLMMYLKYKNMQRLLIERSDLDEKDTCPTKTEKENHEEESHKKAISINEAFNKLGFNYLLDFEIALKIKSERDLAEKWHRQCDMLLFKSMIDKNSVISSWLCDVADYREQKGIIEFTLNKSLPLPKIFFGDFRNAFLKSHEEYLRDLYISTEKWDATYKYEKTKEKEFVKYTSIIKRKIETPSQDMSVNGIYVSYDADLTNDKIKIKVDGSDVTNKIKFALIPSKKRKDYEFAEKSIIYIPFEIPLFFGSSKNVEIKTVTKIAIKSIKENKIYHDGLTNPRKLRNMSAKLTILWEQELFNEMYKEGILFRGKAAEYTKLFGKIIGNKKISVGEACRAIIAPETKDKYYIFSVDAGIVEQNEIFGIVYH